MARDKRSFFERLTGSVSLDEYDDTYEEVEEPRRPVRERTAAPARAVPPPPPAREPQRDWMEEEANEGELAVDMYQTADQIVIRAFVAGLRPEDIDISISRDMVTIKGRREGGVEVQDDNYFHRELYWGSFSRTILLPQEIDTDGAEAASNNGLITLKLPKLDKSRQMKLKVKGS